MSKSQFTEADLMPKGTTIEEWERYRMDLKNHEAAIERKRDFLWLILKYCDEYGIDNARKHFTSEIDKMESMDAPNKPGYYRANND